MSAGPVIHRGLVIQPWTGDHASSTHSAQDTGILSPPAGCAGYPDRSRWYRPPLPSAQQSARRRSCWRTPGLPSPLRSVFVNPLQCVMQYAEWLHPDPGTESGAPARRDSRHQRSPAVAGVFTQRAARRSPPASRHANDWPCVRSALPRHN